MARRRATVGAAGADLPEDGHAPLYAQVRAALERMALERALTDTTALPPEPQLMKAFGVSRGTLRRAVDELVREGLLKAEQGRGTYVAQEERIRRVVWERLAPFAIPDSRFDLELRHYVPDFAGRDRADARVVELDEWARAETIFMMPDNSVRTLRERALDVGKRLLVPTFGFRRGFVVLDGGALQPADRRLAATLDGMELLGERVERDDVARLQRVDLAVTGATATLTDGRVIGRGEPYFAIGWAALRNAGIVDHNVQIVSLVHDCQVLDAEIPARPECATDLIATPTRLIRCEREPDLEASDERGADATAQHQLTGT